MKTTTLNKIRAHLPCKEGWTKLLESLGKTQADDEPLPFSKIIESNGLDDALWCCRSVPEYDRDWRLYAVWCARQVQHLMKDQRSLDAIDVAERHANGLASYAELAAAVAAAGAAAWAAVRDAAGDAAMAAAWDAAWDAAWEAAWDAASDASWAAAVAAAGAAEGDAARAAASDAAWAAARDAQTKEFLRICEL